jgi:phage tail-like protein
MAAGLSFPDPHATFRFVVDVSGVTTAVFTECTLPDIDWDTEPLKEGGLNTYVHQLPGRRKASKVVLKNGLATDALMVWYTAVMSEKFANFKKNISITLLSATHQPVLIWNVKDAYPIKWSGPQLKTSENTVAIQTLELACGEVTLDSGSGG